MSSFCVNFKLNVLHFWTWRYGGEGEREKGWNGVCGDKKNVWVIWKSTKNMMTKSLENDGSMMMQLVRLSGILEFDFLAKLFNRIQENWFCNHLYWAIYFKANFQNLWTTISASLANLNHPLKSESLLSDFLDYLVKHFSKLVSK